VLAAGRGRRIESVAGAEPKPLLPILDRPLLAWQLEALRASGVREVVLVVGHRRERIAEFVGDGRRFGLCARYAEQPEPLGIAHALTCAEPLVERPFVLLLGDVFFDAADLARLVGALGEGLDGVLAVRTRAGARELSSNYRVELGPDGRVARVVEKPSDGRPGLKGVGLYVFRPGMLAAARAVPASVLRGERELTDAIQLFVDGGARVGALALEGPDFNLSEPADLLAANLHALGRAGLERWVAPSAQVERGARLEHAVVLAGARVRAGARLERALVLAGEEVGPGDYREVVFAGGAALPAGSAPGRR